MTPVGRRLGGAIHIINGYERWWCGCGLMEGGADWGTLSKPASEITFVDVVVHMYEEHAIGHALARSRIYICGVIPNPKTSPVIAHVSLPAYSCAAISRDFFVGL